MKKELKKPFFDKVKKAIMQYNLIEDKDQIAVGLSGGKDSLALLYSLAILKKHLPFSFELSALSIDLGWKNDFEESKEFCQKLNIPLHIKYTDIGNIIFNERQEKNPCSLCAKMRRGALNGFAKDLGINKIALGHHADDAIETFLLSLFFEGRLSCFSPNTYLDRSDITIIRPLVLVTEETTNYLLEELKLPVVKNLCPADGQTKRTDMKNLLKNLEKNNPDIKRRILSSIVNYLWQKDTLS